ncbi:hypothetical protein [Enterovibrio paralichthyis]|uniref:hypothetical protein n=1 Tax=Enterovibrio paralichthyis TaxID=2853805 RepID=UPI001C43B55A|nr:hypothetical protein [Enterovibrio paralichthyis]MBV7299596.1 hypothetical protein [Enterovibrio paralichthyis]
MHSVQKVPFFILVAMLSLLGAASVLKSTGIFSIHVRETELMVGGAIYLHMVGSFTLGMLCRLASSKGIVLGLPSTALFVLLLVVLDESLQSQIPSRQFSWLDMTVNVFGVLLGTYFCSAIATVRLKTKANH